MREGRGIGNRDSGPGTRDEGLGDREQGTETGTTITERVGGECSLRITFFVAEREAGVARKR